MSLTMEVDLISRQSKRNCIYVNKRFHGIQRNGSKVKMKEDEHKAELKKLEVFLASQNEAWILSLWLVLNFKLAASTGTEYSNAFLR